MQILWDIIYLQFLKNELSELQLKTGTVLCAVDKSSPSCLTDSLSDKEVGAWLQRLFRSVRYLQLIA